MDKYLLVKISHTLDSTKNILNCFEKDNTQNVTFQLECLKEMLEIVEPFGDFYPVSDVYTKVSIKLGTSRYVIRGIFEMLRLAGFLERESITLPLASDSIIIVDAYSLTFNAMILLE
jgi:hypothetical protein